jgi:tetratricopeptide (TPR) repeat protein
VAAAAAVLLAAAAAAAGWSPAGPKPAAAAAPPVGADEFFARGREYLRAGKPALARADFLAAHERSRMARDLAFAAYALALEGQPGTSAGTARRAIEDGAGSAAVYNNLGYALTQANQLPEARAALDKAVELAPRLPAARYNRAMALFRSGLNDPAGVDAAAADDVRAALDAGLRSPDLHFDAARVFAACSDRDPSLRSAAVEQIRAAVGAGKDPEQCKKDGVLRTRLRNAPDFLAACDAPRGRTPGLAPQLRLVEPGP